LPLNELARLGEEIIRCERCPRLREHCAEVARVKRRAYRDEEYWGRPVPGFGDPEARLLIAGLAPGAHGANRTGRMFTGDRSGEWLYRALHANGFANQAESIHRGDGLRLIDCYITASARCAPPDNKPTPEEVARCRPWLEAEWKLLPRVRGVVALGRLAFDNIHRTLNLRPEKAFGHDVVHELGSFWLISSYHPSQQNTSTGKLTREMLDAVFARARSLI
jgi:uracil-DNA glycosylase family 4